jgi:hypothetical protein
VVTLVVILSKITTKEDSPNRDISKEDSLNRRDINKEDSHNLQDCNREALLSPVP